MSVTLMMAAALVVQAPAGLDVESLAIDRVDVAYEELAARQPNAAIARIKANTDATAEDPAALINLGAAYAMLGQKEKAADYYRAAIASNERYELQLADGSWMDSRRLARMAAKALETRTAFASR